MARRLASVVTLVELPGSSWIDGCNQFRAVDRQASLAVVSQFYAKEHIVKGGTGDSE